jgi:hypothetical protein
MGGAHMFLSPLSSLLLSRNVIPEELHALDQVGFPTAMGARGRSLLLFLNLKAKLWVPSNDARNN